MLHGRLHTFHAVTLKMFLYTLQPSVASTFFPWESTQILQNIAPFSTNCHSQIFNQFSCIFRVCLATFGVGIAEGGGRKHDFLQQEHPYRWLIEIYVMQFGLFICECDTLADLSGEGDGPGLLCSVAFILDSFSNY